MRFGPDGERALCHFDDHRRWPVQRDPLAPWAALGGIVRNSNPGSERARGTALPDSGCATP